MMQLTLHKSDDFTRMSNKIYPFKPTTERSSFFVDNMRPLLTLMKVCGLLPVNVSPTIRSSSSNIKTDMVPKTNYIFFVYSFILYAYISHYIIRIYRFSVPRLVQPKIPFITLINICINLIVVNLFILIPCTHWLDSKKYIEHILQWQRILTSYEEIFGTSPDIKAKKCVFTGIFMIFILIVLLGGILAYGLPDKIYVAIEVSGVIVILTSSATLWCQLCRNATVIGHDLRIRLKNTNVCSTFDFHTMLHVWLKLSTITQEAGDTFTKLIAVSIFLTVLSGVLAAFGQILNILKGYRPDSNTLVSCFFTYADFYNLYLICNVSYKASQSVGRKMLKTILKRNYSNCNLSQLQQIETILLTMKISDPQIHLVGFIRINRKLLVKIYSTLATCLIVLTQFQLTMPYDMN